MERVAWATTIKSSHDHKPNSTQLTVAAAEFVTKEVACGCNWLLWVIPKLLHIRQSARSIRGTPVGSRWVAQPTSYRGVLSPAPCVPSVLLSTCEHGHGQSRNHETLRASYRGEQHIVSEDETIEQAVPRALDQQTPVEYSKTGLPEPRGSFQRSSPLHPAQPC